MHAFRKHAFTRSIILLRRPFRRYQSTTTTTTDASSTPNSPTRWPIVFSGIQPTGVPHLGNYLGALRQWKDLQEQIGRPASEVRTKTRFACYFSIVDLHALTMYKDPATLTQRRDETLAALLAIGLDPAKSTIFVQSDIPQHAELMWILSTVASTGYLSRMTQWKSKLELPDSVSLDTEDAKAKLKLGLFSYPVLQAADILLYHATLVPVGEDQAQHIEFARSLANSFNATYPVPPGRFPLPIPTALISPAKRIMSLKNPLVKMSKSDPSPTSRILITDPPDTIRATIAAALTDSTLGITYDPKSRPGIANLLEILAHTTALTPNTKAKTPPLSCADHAADTANLSMRSFKSHVADAVIRHLDGVGIRDRFAHLTQTSNGAAELARVRKIGRDRAISKASWTMTQIKAAVGMGTLESNRAVRRRQKASVAVNEMKQSVPGPQIRRLTITGLAEKMLKFGGAPNAGDAGDGDGAAQFESAGGSDVGDEGPRIHRHKMDRPGERILWFNAAHNPNANLKRVPPKSASTSASGIPAAPRKFVSLDQHITK